MAEPKSKPINSDVPESGEGAASSPASPPASASSERAGFVADPGPAFDAERAAREPGPEAPAPEEPEAPLEAWEEEVIRSLLGVKGRVLHAAVGVSEREWLYTDLDLDAIAPPLTRICNRYPAIAAYARLGDPIVLASAFGAYATRSLVERRKAIAALQAQETERPIGPAGPGAGPEPAATPSVPAPPPPPRPSSFPGSNAIPQPQASPAPPAPRQRRQGEEPDPAALEWSVGE